MSATTITIDISTLKSLAGKTVLITGGSSGIGLETGKLFHQLGANVVLADRNAPREEDEASRNLLLDFKRARFITCDVTNWNSMVTVFEMAKSEFGCIDVVCANAGINDVDDLFFGLKKRGDGSLEQPDLSTLMVNLIGIINTLSLAFHYMMMQSGGGNIVITASLAGYLELPEMPIYAASKHALVGLMRSLKSKASAKKISISLVAPGMTPTPIMAALPGVSLGPNYTLSDLEKLYAHIRASGVPANKTITVSKAIAFLANGGLKLTGQGLMVLGDEIIELEGPLVASWPQWLLDKTDFIRNPRGDGNAVYDPNGSQL